MAESFAEKLAFVLGALSISRGRLAADLAVDKSVVSRWLSGAGRPTSHNLSRISGIVEARVPGFTMLDWDQSLAALGDRLRPARAETQGALFDSPLFERSRAEIAASGDRYVGLWRSLRMSILRPEAFILEHYLIRRADGQLKLNVFSDRYDWPGGVIVNRGRLDLLFGDEDLAHVMLAPPEAAIIEAMDGLMLTPVADNFRSPCALALLLERVSPPELLDANSAAMQHLVTEARASSVFLEEDQVPEDVRRHLRGPAGDGLMLMNAARSRGRGRWF